MPKQYHSALGRAIEDLDAPIADTEKPQQPRKNKSCARSNFQPSLAPIYEEWQSKPSCLGRTKPQLWSFAMIMCILLGLACGIATFALVMFIGEFTGAAVACLVLIAVWMGTGIPMMMFATRAWCYWTDLYIDAQNRASLATQRDEDEMWQEV